MSEIYLAHGLQSYSKSLAEHSTGLTYCYYYTNFNPLPDDKILA